jgi:hypothetical protein
MTTANRVHAVSIWSLITAPLVPLGPASNHVRLASSSVGGEASGRDVGHPLPMRLRRRSADPHPPRAWSDTAWPVLAGAAGAVGVIGAYRASSVVGLLALFALLAATAGGCLFGLRPDRAQFMAAAAWWAVAAPLGVIATFGLLHAFGPYGLLVTTLVAASSPPVVRRAWRMLVRSAGTDGGAGYTGAARPDYARLERDLVNLRFHELVSGMDDPGEAEER